MTYRIELTPTAVADVENIRADAAEDSTDDAGDRIVSLIQKAIASLLDFPKRFVLAPEAKSHHMDIRHMFVGNHRVIYRIVGDTIWILRVRHASQRELGPGELN